MPVHILTAKTLMILKLHISLPTVISIIFLCGPASIKCVYMSVYDGVSPHNTLIWETWQNTYCMISFFYYPS